MTKIYAAGKEKEKYVANGPIKFDSQLPVS